MGGSTDNSNKGATWVYQWDGTAWNQMGNKLVDTTAAGNTYQGGAVALNGAGTVLAVGGTGDNNNQGAVWMYSYNGIWAQVGSKLVGTGGAAGFQGQGTAVALNSAGTVLASGAFVDNSRVGAVWMWENTGSGWTQVGNKLVGTDNSGESQQGIAVALNGAGNLLAVGGPEDANGQGAVWIFENTGSGWSQVGSKFLGTGNSGPAKQGSALDFNDAGTVLAVGGWNDNGATGATWMFAASGGAWIQVGSRLRGVPFTNGASEQGKSVALNATGTLLVVGAPKDGSPANTGGAYTFSYDGSSWQQEGGKLLGTGTTGTTAQGTSIALNDAGTVLALGGPTDSSLRGAAWTFTPFI